MPGLSLVAASGGFCLVAVCGLLSSCSVQASCCGGFSYFGAQALGTWASVVVARGLSCTEACGTLGPGSLDQGSNQCPLHCKVDSQPLDH